MSNYFKTEGISQSGLTNFSYGPQYYKNKITQEFQDSEALKVGSLVDDLLSNTSEEELKNKYIVSNVSKPTGQMGEFVDAYFKFNDFGLAYEMVGFKRDTLEKVLERYDKEGTDYINFLNNSAGKTVLSTEEYTKAMSVYNSLITNPYTSKHLTVPNNVTSIKQLEIYWEVDKVKCKSKLDDVWFNHTNKTFSVKDFKTTGFHVSEFPKSFLRFRYDLQAAFYIDAVHYFIKHIKPEYSEYLFKDFTFIVESTKYIGTPMIYQCSESDLKGGYNGGIGKDGKEYKGYLQLLTDLIWHIERDEWKYPREVIENNGVLMINAYKN